jgi:hypothetical protein
LFREEALHELDRFRGGVRPAGEHFVREDNDGRCQDLRSQLDRQCARLDLIAPVDSLEKVGPRWSTADFVVAEKCSNINSAPDTSRTCDQRFRKPLLYPLSYGGNGAATTKLLSFQLLWDPF